MAAEGAMMTVIVRCPVCVQPLRLELTTIATYDPQDDGTFTLGVNLEPDLAAFTASFVAHVNRNPRTHEQVLNTTPAPEAALDAPVAANPAQYRGVE